MGTYSFYIHAKLYKPQQNNVCVWGGGGGISIEAMK